MSRPNNAALFAAALVLVIGSLIGLWWSERDASEGEQQAEQGKAEAEGQVAAAEDSLEALCDAGYDSACHQLETLDVPDDIEVDQPEVQQPEIDDPDPNDPDPRDDPDPNDPDPRNDLDPDDAEEQDDEVQDREVQDGDPNDPDPVDDPDPNDPDPDDPDPDDPDPNSALTFAVRDDCNPEQGHVVVDVGLSVQRGDGTVTYIVTCQTVQLPQLPGPGA